MSREVLAIDPDVFAAAATDPRCMHILKVLTDPETSQNYAIAFDGKDVELEYVDLVFSADVHPDVKKYLQRCINERERSDRVQVVRPFSDAELDDELESVLARRKCAEPVEPSLIRVAAGDIYNTVIVLVGHNNLRPRGLHVERTRRLMRAFFREKLQRGFKVILASDFGFRGVRLRNDAIAALNSRIFEYEIAEILLQRICIEYEMPPQNVQRLVSREYSYIAADGKRKYGEADFLFSLDIQGVRRIWIGECKLTNEGNEAQPIPRGKLEQLVRHVEAIRQENESRYAGQKLEIRSYLLTNARSLHSAAVPYASEHRIEFISVKLRPGWSTNQKWKIHRRDVPVFEV